jgi:hypothetical protein
MLGMERVRNAPWKVAPIVPDNKARRTGDIFERARPERSAGLGKRPKSALAPRRATTKFSALIRLTGKTLDLTRFPCSNLPVFS